MKYSDGDRLKLTLAAAIIEEELAPLIESATAILNAQDVLYKNYADRKWKSKNEQD